MSSQGLFTLLGRLERTGMLEPETLGPGSTSPLGESSHSSPAWKIMLCNVLGAPVFCGCHLRIGVEFFIFIYHY